MLELGVEVEYVTGVEEVVVYWCGGGSGDFFLCEEGGPSGPE